MNGAVLEEGIDPPELDAVQRRRVARLGMWLFIASELLFFGGLLFAYAHGRLSFPAGFAVAGRHTDVWLGTLNTGVLLTSSLLVALAVEAAAHGQRRLAPRFLWGAVLLGCSFLAIKGVEYRQDFAEGLVPGPGFVLQEPGAQLFFMLYFTATLLHALHMVVGIVALALYAWFGRRTGSDWLRSSRLETVGLYWHFVDVVWVGLYPLLYLVGRSW
ncbi:cytochrome c oxidase subunit 3 [Xylophilus rhododendri]|uniref:cytochrome c oxidase subunit 3 n=1 Tax=Xylophilus rhododendri TaxID=2697032 RepID=UPI0018A28302|nr:cytochrome c oxidase subunit 3 [Xylophilus rhododendri]